ncbi:MAG: TerC family protein [Gammaproteobacteria bacterium]
MDGLFTFSNFGDLAMLIFLQAVLGFDNLLYISIESQRAPAAQQARVRRLGIVIALVLRLVLLFVMIRLIETLQVPFFEISIPGVLEGSFDFAVLVFLFGGVFIMYTAVKEISHMLSVDDLERPGDAKPAKSTLHVTALIVFMNLVFSFDSILSAIAITEVFPILAAAIVVSGIAMLALADGVARFLEKNRMYEVLGLFVLLIVGVVLLGEGGHQAHLLFFGFKVEPISKTTFYFSIAVLFLVEIIQTRYQQRLVAERARSGR